MKKNMNFQVKELRFNGLQIPSVSILVMIQETVEPFGHVFATCPQETKMVSNFEYEPEQIEDKIIYDPPNKWSPNDLPGLL